MSISENTAKINQLITKINDLPSSAPTVRRVESSFTVANTIDGGWRATYVDCGFKPDVVLLTGFFATNENYKYHSQIAMVFAELPVDSQTHHMVSIYGDVDNENNLVQLGQSIYIGFRADATESGFRLLDFDVYDYGIEDWVETEGKTFNYVAIKYT